MLLSTQHNYAVLCMPKCGSTSAEAMLARHSEILYVGSPALRHTNYRQYAKFVAPFVLEKTGNKHLETICLVREPLSWLASWHRYRSRQQLRDPRHPRHKNSTAGIGFSEFIEAYLSPDPPSYARVGCQFDFVRDHQGRIGVDVMFRLEDMQWFVSHMSGKIGKPLRIPSLNVSPRRVHQSAFAVKARELAGRIGRRLPWPATPAATPVENALAGGQLRRLREFLARDFELYERLASSRQRRAA